MGTEKLPIEPLLTLPEAAEILRLQPVTLRQYASARKIPFLRIGGRLLFDPVELRAWLDARRMRTDREERLEQIELRDFKPLQEGEWPRDDPKEESDDGA